jgi:hypothetical protein
MIPEDYIFARIGGKILKAIIYLLLQRGISFLKKALTWCG